LALFGGMPKILLVLLLVLDSLHFYNDFVPSGKFSPKLIPEIVKNS